MSASDLIGASFDTANALALGQTSIKITQKNIASISAVAVRRERLDRSIPIIKMVETYMSEMRKNRQIRAQSDPLIEV